MYLCVSVLKASSTPRSDRSQRTARLLVRCRMEVHTRFRALLRKLRLEKKLKNSAACFSFGFKSTMRWQAKPTATQFQSRISLSYWSTVVLRTSIERIIIRRQFSYHKFFISSIVVAHPVVLFCLAPFLVLPTAKA